MNVRTVRMLWRQPPHLCGAVDTGIIMPLHAAAGRSCHFSGCRSLPCSRTDTNKGHAACTLGGAHHYCCCCCCHFAATAATMLLLPPGTARSCVPMAAAASGCTAGMRTLRRSCGRAASSLTCSQQQQRRQGSTLPRIRHPGRLQRTRLLLQAAGQTHGWIQVRTKPLGLGV